MMGLGRAAIFAFILTVTTMATGHADEAADKAAILERLQRWTADFNANDPVGVCVRPNFLKTVSSIIRHLVQAVGALNAEIKSLAPVLNSSTLSGLQTSSAVPVATMMRQYAGATYVFATAMRWTATTASFTLPSLAPGTVEVLNENRTLAFSDVNLRTASPVTACIFIGLPQRYRAELDGFGRKAL